MAESGKSKVLQQGLSDCGVACLAMAAGVSYGEAKAAFDATGLSVRRGGKAAYSSNFRELIGAMENRGLIGSKRRFTGWDSIHQLSIIKTNVDEKRNWHWVVAYRDPEYGIVLLDPAIELPCFENPPLDVFYVPLREYVPAGCYIEITASK